MTKDLIFSHRTDNGTGVLNTICRKRAGIGCEHDRTNGVITASVEFRQRFPVSWLKCSFFIFPDGSGFWVSYDPDACRSDDDAPPF